MDLGKKCEIIVAREKGRINWGDEEYYPADRTILSICEDYDNWKDNDTLKNYFKPLIDELVDDEFWEELLRPLNERNWTVRWDNRGATPRRDIVFLRGQIGADYLVYVHGEIEGAYGKQFEVAINGESSLSLLPTIKQFTDELEVGKCFIVHYEKQITFGGNRKKYCYKITEITEDEYLNGVIDARANTFAY